MEKEKYEVKQKTREAVEALGNYASASKAQMESKLKDVADALSRKQQHLGDKTDQQSLELQAALKEKQIQVKEVLNDVKGASQDAWEDARRKSSHAILSVEKWFKDLTG